MRQKHYKAIIFDMDGTIAYTDEMIIQTFNVLYEMYNPRGRKPKEEILYFSGPPLSITLPREFPHEPYQKMYDEFIRISTPFYKKYVTAFEDEIRVLTKLKEKGYKLGVVTNKGHKMAQYVLDLLGINHLIDYLVGGGDTKASKPDPEGLNLAMKMLASSKEDTLYVGDNDIDYDTANNAGIDSMICTWGPRELHVLDKCTYKVSSYKEMEDILL